METREIFIANTKTQTRTKLNTAATTLGELKAALDAAHIDYSGMTFTEGISKTQLLSDDTQLPTNVMYKGHPTNNLVILLTNTKKNIASGIRSRKECYTLIKEHNLQTSVKDHFHANYTNISTPDLDAFISNTIEKSPVPTTCEDSSTEPKNPENIANDMYDIHSILLETKKKLIKLKNIYDDTLKDMIYFIDGFSHTSLPNNTVSTFDNEITNTDIDDMIDNLNV